MESERAGLASSGTLPDDEAPRAAPELRVGTEPDREEVEDEGEEDCGGDGDCCFCAFPRPFLPPASPLGVAMAPAAPALPP